MLRLNRNDLCWCGSGKKYKKCHMEEDMKLYQYEEKGFLIPHPKSLKTPEEIEKIKKSAVVTKGILDMVGEKIKEGVTTEEINTWVHEYTISHGAIPATLNYQGFPKSVCTSINNVVCHGIPDPNTVLKSGDIVNIDVTSIVDGYYSDASRMYKIGEVSETASKIVDVAKECLYKGIEAAKPYGALLDIGRAIEPYAKENGFSVVRDYGGHGLGRKFHEDPHVDHYARYGKGMLLAPGLVFTIEPMINEGTYNVKVLDDDWTVVTRDGGLSAQWEHTVVMTENGLEIIV
ncbi:methionyl aminopeptidase [Clostridium sp. 19966]|nr:methionyl aminopeptidase [Clostridium sp. 19966]MDT8716732.1 methionyl aminopeptidase [Clostridium sp. 19966]